VASPTPARMYRIFNYCSYDNAIGSVGMSGKSLATYACVQFQGYSGYKTMPEAVALMQPRRVILTFGTNDLSSSYSASSFASDYAKGIKAVQDAYPSVDIIVNAIPPLGQQHSNQNLTQTQVDEYNKALVQMCQDNGWKFLNSAEVLKDSSTGYAKSGYVLSSDGIHLTEQAMDALFTYIRTHSYIAEDTRPALTAVPTHTGDKDVSVGSNIVSSTTATIAPETTEAPDEDASDSSSSNGPDWADGTSGSYATATPEYTYWSEIIAPTCTEQGYTYYHCNEDSSKDYKSEYVYETEFGWAQHVLLRDTLANCKGKWLVSQSDFPEVRELFKDYYILEFKRIHSMAQRTHPGSQFGELLIGNYDLLEREREQPEQMSMTEMLGQPIDNEQILKERIIPCRNRTTKS